MSSAHKRWAAIWLRRLSTDRIKRVASPEISAEPLGLATYTKVGSAHLIDAVDDDAALLGISPGMALVDARALQPRLTVLEADQSADQALLQTIAEVSTRWSGSVVIDEPNGIFLEISGTAHLFGGEGGLRSAMLSVLTDRGLSARVTIADTPYAACALTRHSAIGIAAEGSVRDILAPLSIAALRVEPKTRDLLEKLGLKTIDSLLRGPRPPLSARLGTELAQCLDETLGLAEPALTFLHPPPQIFAMRRFLEPLLDAEMILVAARDALQDIIPQLEGAGRGAKRLELLMFDVAHRTQRLRFGFTQAEHDLESLLRPLQEKLRAESQAYDFEFGIDAIRLHVLETALTETEQASPTSRLVDTLSARLGDQAVIALHPGNDHWPERACVSLPFKTARPAATQFFVPAQARPLKLFQHPEPIDVMATVPDGPPRRFRWRRIVHESVHVEGPERIAAHPLSTELTRDYFCVEDRAGARFWMYREGLFERETDEPRWFVHGLFA